MADDAWNDFHDKLSITAAALRAHPDDEELARLAAWLGGALRDWVAIEAAGYALRERSLEATAHVRVADALLDHALGAFAASVLERVGEDPTHALYQRFFPEPHEDIVDLGLDAELPVASLVVRTLEQDEALPAALRDHKGPLGAAVALGNRALTGRADALADLGRHEARIEGWLESAGAMLRSVERTLERLREKRKLGRRWVEAFV